MQIRHFFPGLLAAWLGFPSIWSPLMFPKGIIQNRKMCLRPSTEPTKGERPCPPKHLTSKWKPSFKAMARKILEETVLDSMYVSLRALGSWFFSFQQVKSHQPKRAPNSLPENTLHSPLKEKTTRDTAEVSRDTGSHCDGTRKLNKVQGHFWKTPCYCCLNNWPETWLPLPKLVSIYHVSASVPR